LDPESDGLPIDVADNNIFRLAYLTDSSGIVSALTVQSLISTRWGQVTNIQPNKPSFIDWAPLYC